MGLAWQTDVLHANNHSLSDCRLGGPGSTAQLIREAGGGACDVANCRSSLTVFSCSFKFVVASFPVPCPAFRCLPYCKRHTYSKQRKAGHGTGNEATLYLRVSSQVAERISPSSWPLQVCSSYVVCSTGVKHSSIAGSIVRATCTAVSQSNRCLFYSSNRNS